MSDTQPAANYVQVVEGSFRAYPFDEAERGILARWAENLRNGKPGLHPTPEKHAHALDILRYEATVASLRESLAGVQRMVREYAEAHVAYWKTGGGLTLPTNDPKAWRRLTDAENALRDTLDAPESTVTSQIATPHPSDK